MTQRRKAFVTGASRGIGKAIAIRLAQGGFDVAITARTIEEGEQREHSSTVKKSDTTPLPGSLTSTADAMRAAGAEVLVLPADLLDRKSLATAATTMLERWGNVDVVVHNARFIGPGHMDLITDTPVEVLEKHVQGNAFAPLVLNRVFLPAMLKLSQRLRCVRSFFLHISRQHLVVAYLPHPTGTRTTFTRSIG